MFALTRRLQRPAIEVPSTPVAIQEEAPVGPHERQVPRADTPGGKQIVTRPAVAHEGIMSTRHPVLRSDQSVDNDHAGTIPLRGEHPTTTKTAPLLQEQPLLRAPEVAVMERIPEEFALGGPLRVAERAFGQPSGGRECVLSALPVLKVHWRLRRRDYRRGGRVH